MQFYTLREKWSYNSKYGVISGPYFPVFELNTDQNCLSVFDYFVGLAPKGLNTFETLP